MIIIVVPGMLKKNGFHSIVRDNYTRLESDDQSVTSSDNSLLTSFDENEWKIRVSGRRFLKLGRITLYDGLNDCYITNNEYISILDTHTSELFCFDINNIDEKYLCDESGIIKIKNIRFRLSKQIKNIIKHIQNSV